MKQYQKNILSAFVIVIGGFILFNLAFLLAFLVIKSTMGILGVAENAPPPMVSRALYLTLVCLMSWFVFRSRLNRLLKATYLTMPLMVMLVVTGISLYGQSKWLIAGVGAAIIFTVLYYFYKKKLSWQYFFAVFYVSLVALWNMIFDVQI
jgi:cation transport ATPase